MRGPGRGHGIEHAGRGCNRALRAAGDQMLQAIIFHSHHLVLSEQFDANNGYEKSVSNLSWSYASFLSAVRAR